MPRPQPVLAGLLKRMPKFMHPDFSLISDLHDLRFQIEHEIDIAEDRNVFPAWSAADFRSAKAYLRDVIAAVLISQREVK